MKIFIVVETLDPGYLEYCLAKEISKLGHKVLVFTFGTSEGIGRAASNDGFEVVDLPYTAVISGYHIPGLRGFKRIAELIKTIQPNIILSQPLDSPTSMIFVALKRFYKYKMVGSIMTQLNLFFSRWGLKKKFFFAISKMVISSWVKKECSVFFAKTKDFSALLSASYSIPLNKFKVIPLGSDQNLYKFNAVARTEMRKNLGLSETDILLIYSGKIDQTKGLDVLIKALGPVIRKNSKVKLLILGKGERFFVDRLARLTSDEKIETNVRFQPWVSRSLIPQFYSASDIGVWPGLSSISIVDAASTGLPVIIARYPVEIFAIENNNGFAFQIGNVQDLRTFIEKLTSDQNLRKAMGRRSRLLVEQKLNWATIADMYLDTFHIALED